MKLCLSLCLLVPVALSVWSQDILEPVPTHLSDTERVATTSALTTDVAQDSLTSIYGSTQTSAVNASVNSTKSASPTDRALSDAIIDSAVAGITEDTDPPKFPTPNAYTPSADVGTTPLADAAATDVVAAASTAAVDTAATSVASTDVAISSSPRVQCSQKGVSYGDIIRLKNVISEDHVALGEVEKLTESASGDLFKVVPPKNEVGVLKAGSAIMLQEISKGRMLVSRLYKNNVTNAVSQKPKIDNVAHNEYIWNIFGVQGSLKSGEPVTPYTKFVLSSAKTKTYLHVDFYKKGYSKVTSYDDAFDGANVFMAECENYMPVLAVKPLVHIGDVVTVKHKASGLYLKYNSTTGPTLDHAGSQFQILFYNGYPTPAKPIESFTKILLREKTSNVILSAAPGTNHLAQIKGTSSSAADSLTIMGVKGNLKTEKLKVGSNFILRLGKGHFSLNGVYDPMMKTYSLKRNKDREDGLPSGNAIFAVDEVVTSSVGTNTTANTADDAATTTTAATTTVTTTATTDVDSATTATTDDVIAATPATTTNANVTAIDATTINTVTAEDATTNNTFTATDATTTNFDIPNDDITAETPANTVNADIPNADITTATTNADVTTDIPNADITTATPAATTNAEVTADIPNADTLAATTNADATVDADITNATPAATTNAEVTDIPNADNTTETPADTTNADVTADTIEATNTTAATIWENGVADADISEILEDTPKVVGNANNATDMTADILNSILDGVNEIADSDATSVNDMSVDNVNGTTSDVDSTNLSVEATLDSDSVNDKLDGDESNPPSLSYVQTEPDGDEAPKNDKPTKEVIMNDMVETSPKTMDLTTTSSDISPKPSKVANVDVDNDLLSTEDDEVPPPPMY
mmetsp:Transcript_8211/g.12786  ORF Transcript_8211/g.12786 Transcript_8211/m.12786 type:complete len:877 (-) Transcript_8211:186-2816(-)